MTKLFEAINSNVSDVIEAAARVGCQSRGVKALRTDLRVLEQRFSAAVREQDFFLCSCIRREINAIKEALRGLPAR